MSLQAPIRRHGADQAPPTGLLRSVRLFRLFLAEQSDPEKFYASLATDAVQQVAEHAELGGRTVVDLRSGRRGGRGRLLAAGPRRRGRCGVLLQRAGACPRSDGADRGDDPRDPAGRAGVPVLHQLVLPVGRARDVAVALSGPALRRAPVPPALPAQAQARVRRQPVPGARRPDPAGAAGPAGCRDRGGAAPLLPTLVPAAAAAAGPA